MGRYKQDTCIFTGLPARPIIDSRDSIDYEVIVNGKNHFICLPCDATQWPSNDEFFKTNRHIFCALLLNDNWFEDERNTYITMEKLKELLRSKSFPRSPEEKIESLFLKLISFQEEDGQWVKFESDYYDNQLWKILYFKSVKELNYYVEALANIRFIDAKFAQYKERSGLLDSYRITFDGLNYYLKITSEGDNSNKCFVAMSFKPETSEIRQAIKEALEETDFVPILIDEQNVDSDKTINDEIIANLKKCKFCIADFTFHSNGVYFESGFALGQGKKVIYTCRQDEFSDAHFDIRALQHIIYDTPADLKLKLKNKIEAWIK